MAYQSEDYAARRLLSAMRAKGVSLPRNPVRAAADSESMMDGIKSGSLMRTAHGRYKKGSLGMFNPRTAGMQRQGTGNIQMALPMKREPLGSLREKGIPFDVSNEEELAEIRRWCNTPDAPVWMADYTFKPIGEIQVGEQVIGWETNWDKQSGRRKLVKSTVLAVQRRIAPEVVEVEFESGHKIRCTPDHNWGKKQTRKGEFEYAPAQVGNEIWHVVEPTQDNDLVDEKQIYAAGYLKMKQEWLDNALLRANLGSGDKVIAITSLGSGEVVSMQTTTGNYTAWGFASKNCRIFKATHYLIPLLISIYARFPIQGMSFQSKDPQIKAFYEELFFDRLDYETYMIDFGEEFFTIGEVNSLGSFNETLGVWDNEEIINPDDLIVEKSPFSSDHRYKLRVPQTIRDIIENSNGQSNPRDLHIIQEYYPEFLRMTRDTGYEEGIDISNILLNRTVQKSTPWDTRGTPQMLRCFRQLMSEESLNAAQDAISDRLYSPLILAKLGSPDLGDGEPWIPDPEELEEFRDDMQMAMASDFRFLSYHFGLDIQNVFGRESMPRLGDDYDRIERKILQVWGIGEELISGSNSGTYASSALNREFLTQMMSTYQKYVENHIRRRCEVVAEAQGHFDYEVSNGVSVPIYEEIYEVDENGEGHIRRRPKLLLPDIRFASINLRDEATERQFLMMLKGAGVPISDQALMTNIPFEFEDELEQVEVERVQKVLAEARSNVRAIAALKGEGLPLSSEMQMIAQQIEIAQQDALTGQSTPPEQIPPAAPDNALTSPIPAPNVAPDEMNQMDQPGQTPQSFPDVLPRNQISQRPEISDEMRANAPRMSSTEEKVKTSRWSRDPSIVGKRTMLHEESVNYLVEKRPGLQENKLPAGARRRLAEAQAKLRISVAALESGEHVQDQ